MSASKDVLARAVYTAKFGLDAGRKLAERKQVPFDQEELLGALEAYLGKEVAQYQRSLWGNGNCAFLSFEGQMILIEFPLIDSHGKMRKTKAPHCVGASFIFVSLYLTLLKFI